MWLSTADSMAPKPPWPSATGKRTSRGLRALTWEEPLLPYYDGQPVNFAISNPVIVNNIIAANGADSGGGIALVDAPVNFNAPWGAATVVNNTIIGNTGSGIFWANTYPTNYNNLIAFNSAGLETSEASPVVLKNNDVYGNSVLAQASDYLGLPNATGVNGNISG